MNCVKCENPVKSKSDCVVVYDYDWSLIFRIPPSLKIYHKNCLNEHKAKSSLPPAILDSNQLNRLKDSSNKLLIFWVIIGAIPLILFIVLLIHGSELGEAIAALFLFIFPSLFIYLYKSRLKKIKEIENLPATQK